MQYQISVAVGGTKARAGTDFIGMITVYYFVCFVLCRLETILFVPSFVSESAIRSW